MEEDWPETHGSSNQSAKELPLEQPIKNTRFSRDIGYRTLFYHDTKYKRNLSRDSRKTSTGDSGISLADSYIVQIENNLSTTTL